MGLILAGIVIAVAISIGAGFILRGEQEPAWEVYSTTSARVGDPGQNLVGPDWSGEPTGTPAAADTEPASS